MITTSTPAPRLVRSLHVLAVALLAMAVACKPNDKPPPPLSSQYAGRCVTPRPGLDQPGTLADEKAWVRSWIDELYLWYREVPAADPAAYATPELYFNVLKTPALTASGQPKDRFHFIYSTAAWEALSQSGIEAGYGVQWVLLASRPPRQVVAAYVEAGSPADLAGIARGTEVLTVDGVDVVASTDIATLNVGLFPSAPGAVHQLGIKDLLGTTRTVSVTSAAITGTPVPTVRTITTTAGPVGYILFNDHILTAEAQLVAAVQQLKTAGVTDLVLDLRYNGGGYLAIAAQVAYMIAGPTRTSNKIFERLTFNDKAGTLDPINRIPNLPYGFVTTGLGWPGTLPASTPLPYLGSSGLGTVYVLTGSGTCSASESIINSLRGVGVTVIQIGAATCGKPYGFYPQDNCGTTYFAIQFQGVNQQGFGDYGDGFVPGGPGANGLPGCAVADDFGHALGDPAEGRLAVALGYRATGTCTPAASVMALRAQRTFPAEGEVVKSPWRQNRILAR
jgi:hypothetical protein